MSSPDPIKSILSLFMNQRKAQLGSRENPAMLPTIFAKRPPLDPRIAQLMNSPFFKDTLSALPSVGFSVRTETDPLPTFDPDRGGMLAFVSRKNPQTIVFSEVDPNVESTLTHEVAHVMDLSKLPNRERTLVNKIKDLSAARIKFLLDLGEPVSEESMHAVSDPMEYLAWVMDMAMQHRRGMLPKDITLKKMERWAPGVSLADTLITSRLRRKK